MATLYFKVSSDYQEVIRLRQECEKLEAQLKKMDVTKSPAAAKALETQLASTRQQMIGLVTEAAKAGAVMEHDFKDGIYNASQTVNNLSANITSQRGVIRQLQNELTLLKEKYRETVKSGGDTTGMSEQIKAQTTKLREQKDVLFGLTQQQAEARLSVKRLKDEYSVFKEEAGETVEANEKVSISLTKVLGVIGGVTALKNFVTELVNVRGQFQQLEIAFTTMLKSKGKADKLMAELVDIAAKTPFDLQGVASSAKQMLAYGSSVENVGDELVMLGNVAAGVGSQLSEIAYLYGTLRTQGRAYAVDIRQFAGRGIPIYEELAKVLGVTKSEVAGLVTEGKVGFKEVEQAFKNMTSASGIYYNLMEEQSKSLTGQLSNLGDAWDTMLNEIGKSTQGIASAGISGIKTLIENYEIIGKVLVGLIATYGTYKASLFVVKIAQDTLTARMQLAILVTKAQTLAQRALNTVMKANPYVLVATALAGVVTAMWAFHDSTNAAEKAQQKFNEEQKRFVEQEEGRKQKIDELIRIIQDETETEYSKIKAYEELQRYSPALTSAYTREQLAVLNLAAANKELNKERDKNSYENILKNIRQWEDKIKSLKASMKNAGQGAPLIASQMESAKASLNQWKSALNEYNRLKREAEENSKPIEVKLMEAESNREQIVQEYNAARQALQEVQEKLKNTPFAQIPFEIQLRFNNAQKAMNESDSLIAGLKSEQNKSEKSYKDAYNEAKKEYEAKLKAVKDAKKATEKEYKKAVEELEDTEKKYKALGGVTGSSLSKQENQAKKEAEQRKKEQEQFYDELLQLRFKNQQDEINLMKEGAEKKRRQIELDYQEEYAEILKLEKEWSAKNGGKLSQEQAAEVSLRYTNAENKYYSGVELINAEEIKSSTQSMYAYLREYGNFNEQLAAIKTQYAEKIGKAGGLETWEGKSLLKERDSLISEIEEEANRTTSSISRLFGDMKEKTLADLQEINERGKEALEFLKGGRWDASKGAELGITEANFKEWSQDLEKIEAATNAIKLNQEAIDELRPAYDKVTDGVNKFFAAGSDPKKVTEALQDIQDGLSGIMQITSFLSSMFSSLGDSFGSDTLSGIADGLNTAMDAVNSAMQGAQAGAMFGPIGAAAGAAIGLVGSLASSIAKIHDKKNERQIQKLQDQIDALDKSYERLGKSVEEAYSKDASRMIEQQNTLLEQQKVLIQNQIREEQEKKKTDDNRIKEWQQQIDEINSVLDENKEKMVDVIFGEDIQSAIERFSSAVTDMWADNVNGSQSARDAVKQMMQQMVTESIKSFIQSSNKMEEIRQKLQQFYADNVLSGWEQDYIYNMADELQKEIDRQFGWAEDLFKDDEKEQQSASGRGFGTEMTHEDAGELSGRFTAVHESNLRIEAATQQQTVAITELRGSISGLISQTQGLYNIADETRTILANSYLELQEIRENTGEIIKPIKQMQEDMAEVKRNTSRL